MNPTPTVTAADIVKAIDTIKRNPGKYMPQRPLPATPGRRKQAVLAAGRDAVAVALFEQVPGTNWGNLTKAIRKGCNAGVVFEAINLAGAQALGLIPSEPQFIEGSTFTGATFPRYESRPDGPQSQSMVKCTCGAYWKHHRMVDGACPRAAA